MPESAGPVEFSENFDTNRVGVDFADPAEACDAREPRF